MGPLSVGGGPYRQTPHRYHGGYQAGTKRPTHWLLFVAVNRFDWTIIRTAATGGLIVIVPGALIAAQLFDRNSAPGLAWLFLALALVGFALAGYIAGRLRPDTPMLHGASSAFLAFAVAQIFGVLTTVARGATINLIAIPLTGLLAVSMGVAGALISDRVHRRATRLA